MKFLFCLASVALASLGLATPLPENGKEKRWMPGNPFFDTSFDYIIIGGGTAGLTLAKRLAENRALNVAVIEAGEVYQIADPLLAETPGGDVTFVGTDETMPLVDWGIQTASEPASGNKARYYARGKCLGGSSSRNFMIYQRPTIGAMQQWADAVDDQSYTFNNLLPYYKKSVHFTPPTTARAGNATALQNSGAFSSTGGPLHVSFPNYAQPFSGYMQGALTEMGFPVATDFNSGSLMGSQYCSSTIDPATAKRDSSETSFLAEATLQGLFNLKIFTGTMVKKIIFNSDKRATGVQIQTLLGLLTFTLQAEKEIIVSAGTFQSPQLLMVSGVGPAAQLQQHGIEVIADRPGVGQNLQDHIFFGPSYRVNVQTLTLIANNIDYVLAQFPIFESLKLGPLTNPVADFLGWEKLPQKLKAAFTGQAKADLAKLPSDWPEVEYISGAGYVGDFSSLLLGQPKDGYQYATILSTLVAPQSRGNVTITSADTNVLPTINMGYLQSPTDQQVAVAAYKRAREAFATKYMGKITIGPEYYPGLQVQSDEDILNTIKGSLQTVWHAAATCKMGTASDPMAVVDSNAKVYGVSGLRVVDASAFPFLPPGHPQSTIYALAEKIADGILNGN